MTTPVAHLDDAERRRRLVERHRLAEPAATTEEAAEALVGLHGTDPTSVVLALRARVSEFAVDHFEQAAYVDRAVVRMLGMRRTVFVVPRATVGIVQAACTDRIAARERTRVAKLVRDQGHHHDPEPWLAEIAAEIDAHLATVGEAPARDLSRALPVLATKLHLAVGKPYAGTTGLGSQLLGVLAAEGRLVRARPLGSWTSSQFCWARTADWLGAPIERPDPTAARTALVGRWLGRFGPGTDADLAWWSGLPLGQVRAALTALGAQRVTLDGTDAHGWVAADDHAPTPPRAPTAALLPALDPTTMGWKHRDWYLGSHGVGLFDRNGNGGPTIWWDGRIVGGWAQRPDGEIALRVVDDVGAAGMAAIEAEADALCAFLGDVRYRTRFPTPVEQELLA